MGTLTGRLAVVTGCARMNGIGRAIALALAENGADVVVTGRLSSRLPDFERDAGWRGIDSVAAEIAALGRRSLAVTCDVAVEREVLTMFDAAQAALGTPTIVANNAAAPSERGQTPLTELPLERWQQTLDVNLTGAFLVARTGAVRMVAAGLEGAIVNIGSTTGRVPIANFGSYCVAKFGMIGLTQQLALELAPHGIRVNCVCPGTTNTDLMISARRQADADPGGRVAAMLSRVQAAIPLARVSDPREQAEVVAFLAGPRASYITGQSINVDGGARMD